MKAAAALFIFAYILLDSLIASSSADTFDVRRHLSTATGYDAVKGLSVYDFEASTVPEGCSAIHLNLLARHGTRSPTKKRIKQLNDFAIRLEALLKDAKEKAQEGTLSLQMIPGWLWEWKSPWKGKKKGGELVSKGEEELYRLGIRTRERFPNLFGEEYHPDIFSIRATQVPRASASAVAFGMGLFCGKGSLGPGRHRSFAVICESRASDICLRFHDTCESYKEYRRSQEPAVEKLKEPILDEISSKLVTRYHLNFTSQDIATLWLLCKQEASLLDIDHQACGLFSPSELALLEWADDLEAFILKGYGKEINYHMGVPLLQDVVQSMEEAIVANEENYTPGTFEKARLQFAHAETLIPFTCLLGLFRDGSDLVKIHRMEPLDPPAKPPQKRYWRGSILAPFAGNNMLALYSCPRNDSSGGGSSGLIRNKYLVQVLHNEVPVPLPGCGNRDICQFEVFKERVVNPYVNHSFVSLCSTKDQTKIELPLETHSTGCKYSKFFGWLFRRNDDASISNKQKLEL